MLKNFTNLFSKEESVTKLDISNPGNTQVVDNPPEYTETNKNESYPMDNKKDLVDAVFLENLSKSKNGNADAMYAVGLHYHKIGNLNLMKAYLLKAIAKKHLDSMYFLGKYYSINKEE